MEVGREGRGRRGGGEGGGRRRERRVGGEGGEVGVIYTRTGC